MWLTLSENQSTKLSQMPDRTTSCEVEASGARGVRDKDVGPGSTQQVGASVCFLRMQPPPVSLTLPDDTQLIADAPETAAATRRAMKTVRMV